MSPLICTGQRGWRTVPKFPTRQLCRSGNRPSPRGGFSLIECAVVLTCASILLVASVPAFDHLYRVWTLWTGTRLMETTLQWGRFHSIAANASLMLEVNAEGTCAAWRDPETGNSYGGGVCYLPKGVWIASAPSKPLRFFPRGNAAPAGSYVVRNGAGSFRVVVSPAGRIRVEKL